MRVTAPPDADDESPRAPAARPALPRALWLLYTALMLVVLVFATAAIWREGGRQKPLGWSPQRAGDSWVVGRVDPRGAAAAQLAPGDVILAIDGDSAAARLGPRWFLRDSPDRTRYGITVRRGDAVLERDVPWPVVVDTRERAWQWVHIATGYFYLAVALLIGLARPDAAPARRAALSTALSLGFFVTLVLETDAGIVAHVPLAVALTYYFVRPLHLLASYAFILHFPVETTSTPAWRRFNVAIVVAGLLLWLPSVAGAAVRALGPERAVAFAAAQYPFSLLHDAVVNSFSFVYAAIMGIANAAVAWRNHRLVPSPDLQRRLRWVSVGIAAGMLPIVLFAPILVLRALDPSGQRASTLVHVANLVVVAIPISITYAVLRHRVLGIGVVVRTGVRYLLARRVLSVLLFLPAVALVALVVSNRGRTIGELLVGSSALGYVALLVLAALALRYRAPLMQRIDRRFFREAYQQDRIFVALAEAVTRAADIPSLAQLLASQLSAALHPTRVLALARQSGRSLEVAWSSEGRSMPLSVEEAGIPVEELRDVADVALLHEIPTLSPAGRAAMRALGLALVVPVRGPNEGLVGLLLLGEKRSEEPYTRNDRRLLGTAAAQTGVVWENLQLRAALQREQAVRRTLVDRLGVDDAALTMECPACGRCFDGDVDRCPDDASTLAPSLPVARVLDGKYLLDRVVGRGGVGTVYRATDLRLGRTVAVKTVMAAIFDDSQIRQRFDREARASARIVHPNVVGVHDIGDFDGGAYLVLEFLEGRTLRAAIDGREGVDPGDALPIFRDICAGVEAAHAQGVVHRDLKPENVFLLDAGDGRPPRAKLLDFGLAVVRDAGLADEERLTKTGMAVGTLAYMSPEQLSGEPVDERTDVHALGIILVEMLSGPIAGTGPFFVKGAAALRERFGARPPGDERRTIRDVLERALAPARRARHQSVAELLADVERALEDGTS